MALCENSANGGEEEAKDLVSRRLQIFRRRMSGLPRANRRPRKTL